MRLFRKILCRYAALLPLAAAVAVLFAGCGGTETVLRSSYTENALSVTAAPVTREGTGPRVTSVTVELAGLRDRTLQEKLTSQINAAVKALENAPYPDRWGVDRLVPEGSVPEHVEVTCHVAANFGGRLSLLMKKASTFRVGSEDVTLYAADTRNYGLSDGRELAPADLFREGFDAGKALYERLTALLSTEKEELLQAEALPYPLGNLKFTFSGTGITFYADQETPEILSDPTTMGEAAIPYDETLFSALVIFDDPAEDLFEPGREPARHLLRYPSVIRDNVAMRVNGMELRALVVTPASFASRAAEERVMRLAPSVEDVAAQATGTGDESYSCYFYAERVGKFMTVRFTENDRSGMNSFSSDRMYVFDAVTAGNLSVKSLFREGFDYAYAIARVLYPGAEEKDLQTEAEAIRLSQIIPREDHFLVRYTARAEEISVLWRGGESRAPYEAVGPENLTIYD